MSKQHDTNFSNCMAAINALKFLVGFSIRDPNRRADAFIRVDQLTALFLEEFRQAIILEKPAKKSSFDYGTTYRPENPLYLVNEKESDSRFIKYVERDQI